MEQLKNDTMPRDGDAGRFFQQPAAEAEDGKEAAGLKQRLETLEGRLGGEEDRTEPKRVKKKDGTTEGEAESDVEREEEARGEPDGGPEQQRGRLREQAVEQLDKLKTTGKKEPTQQKNAASPDPSGASEQPAEDSAELVGPAGDAAKAAAKAGYLSLNLQLDLQGKPHHFRKLHGEPRLVLNARHEGLHRLLIAVGWAALCLLLAGAAVYVLRRPDAAVLARRVWPWLTVIAGSAWLFLLPVGVLGLGLLVASLWVLISRTGQRNEITHGGGTGTR